MKSISQYTRWVLPAALLFFLTLNGTASWGATPQVAAGSSHTIFLHSDGTLWGAGQNSFGQLGDGTLKDHDAPARIGTAGNWTAIAAGLEHNLALKADGTLWAWGLSDFGQLGITRNNGSPVATQTAPVQVGTESNWVAVAAAGGASSYALKADGTLWAWGDNSLGQLGNPASGAQVNLPVQVANPDGPPFVAIASGAGHALALKTDGTLWSWGSNANGELGLGNTLAQAIPATPAQVLMASVASDNDWIAIAAGESHSLALKADGTLWSWGSNSSGQLGQLELGIALDQPDPTQVGTDQDWARICAGSLNTLAIKRNGTLWSFGDNRFGQLGSGQNAPLSIGPVPASPGNSDFVAVSGGAFHGIALKSNGNIYSFGDNRNGQFGSGTRVSSSSLALATVDALGWVASEPGNQFTIARRSNGTLWGWGDNTNGQLGDNSTLPHFTPAQIGSASNWSAHSAGSGHVVALRSDGTLWSWGDNFSGQLGDNTRNTSLVPIQITDTTPNSAVNDWAAVAAGESHTLALKADGTLWSWGDNSSGQLGDNGNTPSGKKPNQVVTAPDSAFDRNWVAIAAGGAHSMALQADGSLWTWGDNSNGQLGHPSGDANPAANTPNQVGFLTGWKRIAAGASHSLALQADGTLWAWGFNFTGQLGNGDAVDQALPVPVLNPGSAPFVTLAAGIDHSLARKADGTLWSWGNNTSGQLGIGAHADTDIFNPVSNAAPVQIGLSGDWASVSASGNHSVALMAAGTLFSWGSNFGGGQLGVDPVLIAGRNAPEAQPEAFAKVASTLDFGPLAVSGSAVTLPLSIANPGNSALTITDIAKTGTDPGLFSVSLGNCGSGFPATVAARGSCQLQVTFTPSAFAGGKAASLSINSNDPVQPQAKVSLAALLAQLYTVTTSVTPAGAGTVTGPLQVVPGSSPVYSITANTGYHVTDVKLGGVSQGVASSLTLAAISAGTSIEAFFALNPHTVTLIQGAHGTIAGPTAVLENDRPTYTFTAAPGSFITGVTVNGVSQGVVSTLTLPPITGDVIVAATFGVTTYTMTATGGARGSISPSGQATVPSGTNQTYTFTPNAGYKVVEVKVDGVSQGSLPSYTFNNVTANGHTLSVLFIPDGDLVYNGVVDITDALQALKVVVGLTGITPAELLHADVAPLDAGGVPTPDNELTIADALVILKKVVKLTSGF